MLDVKQLSMHYTANNWVLQQVGFQAKVGEITVLAGLSGSGKSTLLKCIAGIETPENGCIKIDGVEVFGADTNVHPGDRKSALVFQNHALFPHLSAMENVGMVIPKGSEKTAEYYLNLVGLAEFSTRKPNELSGGQQQRVAIARALAYQPKLILFDEPLSSLDVLTAKELRSSIRALLKKEQITAIWVAHQMEEAYEMADAMVILKDGKVLQAGEPHHIYNQPSDADVAQLASAYLKLPHCLQASNGLKSERFYRLNHLKISSGNQFEVVASFFHEGEYIVTLKGGDEQFKGVSNQKLEPFSMANVTLDTQNIIQLND